MYTYFILKTLEKDYPHYIRVRARVCFLCASSFVHASLRNVRHRICRFLNPWLTGGLRGVWILGAGGKGVFSCEVRFRCSSSAVDSGWFQLWLLLFVWIKDR
jgi:hypothetical protein